MMANLGMADTLILMVLALVVFGPRRLPQIGRQIGKLMYEFRKASNDFKFQMEEELRQAEEADRRKKQEEERQRALAATPLAPEIEAAAALPAPEVAPVTPAAQESPIKPVESETPATPAAESPYGNPTYPEVPAESGAEATAASASPPATDDRGAHSQREAAVPRILPPSTGETIAAIRPGAQAKQQEPFAPPHDSDAIPETVAPRAEKPEPDAQHAAQHAARNG